MPRIPVKEINITQVEGDADLTGHRRVVENWDAAESMISRICMTGPQVGTYKVDFKIVWVDGEEYKGTYEAAAQTSDQYTGTLSNHVVGHCIFMAGLVKAPKMGMAKYQAFLRELNGYAPGSSSLCSKLLAGYDLGATQPSEEKLRKLMDAAGL